VPATEKIVSRAFDGMFCADGKNADVEKSKKRYGKYAMFLVSAHELASIKGCLLKNVDVADA
jgi:hypothetical protein